MFESMKRLGTALALGASLTAVAKPEILCQTVMRAV